jgi:hypothetical protein
VIQRVKPSCAADMSWWAGRFLLEGFSEEERAYECYWLRLPSYGYHYQARYREERWCQLVLFWHGRDGLTWFWEPCPKKVAA